MKKKLAVVLLSLFLVLCYSAAVLASPFNIIVGKQDEMDVSFGGTGPGEFRRDFSLTDSFYVYQIDLFTSKHYNRCGGVWFAELFDAGLPAGTSDYQAFCKTPGCEQNAVFNYIKADKVLFDTKDFRTSTSEGSCTFSAWGPVRYIDGIKIQKQIPFYVADSSAPFNLGRLDSILANTDIVTSGSDEITVVSDNQQVLVWIGSEADTGVTTTDASDLQKTIWACYDSDKNRECDYVDGSGCLDNGGDYYKGLCCGTDIKECGIVREFNGLIINAYCGRVSSKKWKWAAFDQVGEVQNLAYCPGNDVFSDGAELFFCNPDSKAFQARTGHEYLCHNNHLYECGGQKPYSYINKYATGQKSTDISGFSCPQGIQGYWKLDGNADDFFERADGSSSGLAYEIGAVDMSARFNGNAKITFSDSLVDIDGKGFTAEAWIYMDDIAGTYSVFSKDKSYELIVQDGALTAAIETDKADWARFGSASLSNAVTPNDWHHVALAYDGERAALYLDGNSVFSQPIGGSIVHDSDFDSAPLILGDKQSESLPFKGKIDEFAVYSIALDKSVIQAHAGPTPSAYCYDNPYTDLLYCASDGDWTSDLDAKDELSCNLAGFDWTGHACCSEDTDLDESYNDFALPLQDIGKHIIESSPGLMGQEQKIILDEDNEFVVLKGPVRFKVVTQSEKKPYSEFEYCADVSVEVYNLTDLQSKRITNKRSGPANPSPGCTYRKKIISPMTLYGIGGCINKTFVPSGSFADSEKRVINYQGQFYACELPSSSQLWNIEDTSEWKVFLKNKQSCSEVLQNIIYDEKINAKHAVCLPGGKWYFTGNPNSTVEKHISWQLTQDLIADGCCPEEECWNGTGCQKSSTYYRIGDSGFVCK